MVTEQNLFFAAGVVGLGPALALMFLGLRRYDYPYVDKALFSNRRLFGSFAIGMIAGTLSAAATYFLFFSFNGLAGFFILFLLIGIFDESFKLIYLNSKPLRGRFDVIFYGVALGLGMAATTAMAWAYQSFHPVPGLPEVGFTPITLTALAALSVGFNGVGSFTGAVLGLGAAQGYMRIPFTEAISARLVLAFLLAVFMSSPVFEVILGAAVMAAVLAGVLAWVAYVRVLPEALPQDVRRQRRRRARRGRAARGP